jgi:VIT1/CCC1 family predicted Fe2+/Mn2+ transporter
LIHRYLDPASSLGEVLFGLIMTLTFTLGAGLLIEDEGREGARELLIALIGCNIAWGIIDGVLYLVGELFHRSRLRSLGQAVRRSADERVAIGLVSGEFGELLEHVTSESERDTLYRKFVQHVRSRPAVRTPVTKEDLLGAMTSFFLVVLASVPAAVPFLLMDEARAALRVSNAVLLVMLFTTGYWWARATLGNPWLVGFLFLIGGVVLVAIAIALGG